MRTLRFPALIIAVTTAALALTPAIGSGASQTATTTRMVQGRTVFRGATRLEGSRMASSFRPSREAPRTAKPSAHPVSASLRAALSQGSGVPTVPGSPVVGPGGLGRTFSGLNGFDQRYANGGNQFSVEPPDQGLCIGGGAVLEVVNSVLRVYSTRGAPLSGVSDLNTFYQYPAQFNRTTGRQGPFITDPSCYFDPTFKRWVVIVSTLEVRPVTGAFTGKTHLDIAVSQTSSPLGAWNLYSIPTEDNGTHGTPNDHCYGGSCFGDYPHLGADAHGFYISTDQYPVKTSPDPNFGFKGAQVYAISRAVLTSGASGVSFVHIDNPTVGGQPGYDVWPASSPGSDYATVNGGTEYFLSSNAEAEVGNFTGRSDQIILWSLTNSDSLGSASPAVKMSGTLLSSERYVFPPYANQRGGSVPLAQCLNVNCLGFGTPSQPLQEGQLDEATAATLESGMLHTWYANGLVMGALDTAVRVSGQLKGGVAWFIVSPTGPAIVHQGYMAVSQANLGYPTVATLASGRGIISFTLSGTNYYPSAAYAFFGPLGPAAVHVAASGVGPQDGFTEYGAVFGAPPRWGDYGAAVAVGDHIWFGAEYIGQRCTFAQYLKDMTCGGTRAPLINWGTRISQVTP